MHLETFKLERNQSLYENHVAINLSDSGMEPYSLNQLLTSREIAPLLDMKQGYGQTNGLDPLREAVGALYPGAREDGVLITTGTIEANFAAIWTLLEPGDEICYMQPNYYQIRGLARSLGAVVKPFWLTESTSWQTDAASLQAVVGPKTRIICVCNPNNPTGAAMSAEAMDAVVEQAARYGAWILADEVYRGSEYDGVETPTFYGRYDKVIVTAGLSKAYALPGLRIGWLVGPADIAAKAWSLRDYTTISTAYLSNHIALLALQEERRAAILQRTRTHLAANLKSVTDWMSRHPGVFTLVPPVAGGMAFLRYAFDMNSTELVGRLREEQSILLVAGDDYDMDGFVRLGFGGEQEHLAEGLSRFSRFLGTLTK
ncbi:MAG: aminotransferase class I/II-fold pyridoxal phosphate-dependent enzyme [Acidobacteriota bacterium]|nr:aminotransferase class I/II-fold pyridoxal phosphate-dependent enzyme [Acidobacteriota bacterium]